MATVPTSPPATTGCFDTEHLADHLALRLVVAQMLKERTGRFWRILRLTELVSSHVGAVEGDLLFPLEVSDGVVHNDLISYPLRVTVICCSSRSRAPQARSACC